MFQRFGVPTLYLLTVFVCGAAVGGFAYHFYAEKTEHPRPQPEEWKKRHLKEMRLRLKLTDQQTGKLSAILDQTRVEYHGVIERQRPEMEQVQARQYERVKAILTPEQIPEYETYHAERERRRHPPDHK